MKKKGFTLIELLAVIVILAVIAIIVTPMIMGTINSVRQSAIKSSAQSIIHAAETFCTRKQTSGESFSDRSFVLNESTANTIGYSYNNELTGTIAIYSDCKVAIATTNGVYQATKAKADDDVVTANKSATFDDDAKKLVITTPESCFMTSDNADGTVSINGYLCSSTDIVFPEKIGSKYVSVIDSYSFGDSSNAPLAFFRITSVDFSNMSKLETIGQEAFYNNKIKIIDLSNLPSLKTIEERAFYANDIEEIKLNNLPKLTSINSIAFGSNNIKSLIMINLPLLSTIQRGAFQREKHAYNDVPIDTCSPNYTFGGLPSLKEYNSTDESGVNLGAFGDCGECDTEIPTITYKDDNISIFKTQPFKYAGFGVCR